MIFDYIDGYYFFISLCIGIFFVYIISYQPEVIIKFPTPDSNTIYKDKNDICYKYDSREVKCDMKTKEIEIQTNDNDTVYDKIIKFFR